MSNPFKEYQASLDTLLAQVGEQIAKAKQDGYCTEFRKLVQLAAVLANDKLGAALAEKEEEDKGKVPVRTGPFLQ